MRALTRKKGLIDVDGNKKKSVRRLHKRDETILIAGERKHPVPAA